MRIDEYKELFNDYYINHLTHNKISKQAKSVDNSILNKYRQHSNEVQVNSKTLKIPGEVIKDAEFKNIKLEGFKNIDNNISYISPSEKRLYLVHTTYHVSQFNLKDSETISVNVVFKSNSTGAFNLVLIEYDEYTGINVRRYENTFTFQFVPSEKSKTFKVFIEPLENMYVYDLEHNVTKSPMNIIHSYEFNLTKNNMYIPDENITFEKGEHFSLNFPETDRSYIYLSYGINNNSFNKVPERSLIPITNNNLYQFEANFSTESDIEVTPTIIEYNEKEKTNLIKLSNIPTFIKFQNDTKYIRFSYRFSGHGEVKLSDLKVTEYESETLYRDIEWNSRYELDSYLQNLREPREARIAAIMDEFTFHSYEKEANLLRLSFDNWKSEIQSFMPHMLFIESSWHGNNEEWTKRIAFVTDEKHSHIKELVSFCNELNIPTVFWSKEDPVHYDHFIETAKICDFVFTTDQDKVPDYRRDCGHDNVDVLQFAAQPSVNNPTKIQKKRTEGISFAGSYYALREERSMDMNRLFRAAIPYNLYIYDRNYEYTKRGERLNFLFPEEFRQYILGTLPFYQIDKAYKGYKFMININTVKESPTMFARRVYEGLASGTPIISNYSRGMDISFGDLIGLTEDEAELNEYLDKLNSDESEYNKTKQLGIRRVMEHHTYKHRIREVLNKIGYHIKDIKNTVTFIGIAQEPSEIKFLEEIFETIAYEEKHLIIFTAFDINSYSSSNNAITYIHLDQAAEHFETLGNLISDKYVLPINPEDYYSTNYLKDLLLATEYTDADVIGKSEYYLYKEGQLEVQYRDSEHEYTQNLSSYSSLIKSDIFSNVSFFEAIDYIEGSKLLSDLGYTGKKYYSNDKMNYIKNGFKVSGDLKAMVTI